MQEFREEARTEDVYDTDISGYRTSETPRETLHYPTRFNLLLRLEKNNRLINCVVSDSLDCQEKVSDDIRINPYEWRRLVGHKVSLIGHEEYNPFGLLSIAVHQNIPFINENYVLIRSFDNKTNPITQVKVIE